MDRSRLDQLCSRGYSGKMRKLTMMERAFEMARSGEFEIVSKIRDQLQREGYEAPHLHLSGRAVKLQLTKLIKEARGLPMRAPVVKT